MEPQQSDSNAPSQPADSNATTTVAPPQHPIDMGAMPQNQSSEPTSSEPLHQLTQALPQSEASQEPAASPSTLYSTTEPQLTAPIKQDDVVPAYENIYTEICSQIIKEQGRIIGMNLALEQAQGVAGLSVDPTTLHCMVEGDGSKVINDLIEKYSEFFGHAAIEVCREAASRYLVNLSDEQTPSLLK
jgi:hypothetical protein